MSFYHNIVGDTAVKLLDKSDLSNQYNTSNLTSINICNIHATDECSVDLYLYKEITSSRANEHETNNWDKYNNIKGVSTTIYYIIKDIIIPHRGSLLLERPEIDFDNSQYSLYIKLKTSGEKADVIINSHNINTENVIKYIK